VTCQKDIPRDWYEPVKENKLPGLASGGGQQMLIFVALGADVNSCHYFVGKLRFNHKVYKHLFKSPHIP